MDQLTAIRTFTRVVQTGSFSAVARELGVGQSSVSNRVAALETKLGTRLLARTSRKLKLTETGADYYERCLPILIELDEAESAVSSMTCPYLTIVPLAIRVLVWVTFWPNDVGVGMFNTSINIYFR